MIADSLIFIAMSIFGAIIELLPEANPTTTAYIGSQFATLKSALNTINWFFPVDQLYIVLGFVFLLESYALTTKILFWITENLSLGLFKSPK